MSQAAVNIIVTAGVVGDALISDGTQAAEAVASAIRAGKAALNLNGKLIRMEASSVSDVTPGTPEAIAAAANIDLIIEFITNPASQPENGVTPIKNLTDVINWLTTVQSNATAIAALQAASTYLKS